MPKPPAHDTTDETALPDEAHPRRAAAPAPTLDEAFTTLGQALLPHLEDNLPLTTHVEQAMGIYADGNATVAWQQLIGVLEGVLGTPLVPR